MTKAIAATASFRSPMGRSATTGTGSSLTAASVSAATASVTHITLPVFSQSASPVVTLDPNRHFPCRALLRPQSASTPTAETDTATRALRSVMERTLDTRHVTHTSQGEHGVQTQRPPSDHLLVCVCVLTGTPPSSPCSSYGLLRCTPYCVIDSTNCKYFT